MHRALAVAVEIGLAKALPEEIAIPAAAQATSIRDTRRRDLGIEVLLPMLRSELCS